MSELHSESMHQRILSVLSLAARHLRAELQHENYLGEERASVEADLADIHALHKDLRFGTPEERIADVLRRAEDGPVALDAGDKNAIAAILGRVRGDNSEDNAPSWEAPELRAVETDRALGLI